ncbi:hypothetical protein BXZ70DRAFT_998103 [Cristinia sonorae]|uniref:Diphthine--ammonia ligase n=1 Tax=Cristinia sonorae TaxID=1940300 RepID=A0A8K0XU79_9AGAR|nr:hypothetical protein BXZ70DRAFT_998103 [Cristinia sonorae]
MKYVALLSGGKDSCYNLMHCHRNGHVLVAAASLGPGQGKDEIDSYMYQTVGQDAIELVAQALDVPLYRRVITGIAVNMGSEYGSRTASENKGIKGDETEDLFELLSAVKSSHPDIEGVSVGAILSTYQRVRVEHVCRRLSLTPLCYLWQRDQAELLAEMIQSGLEAILIKVAGIGLTKEHLGRTLAQMQPTLTKLNALYELHVCGEGGEYETLTLDCSLFKRRITLKETETVIHSDSDFATVAYLRVLKGVLEEKQPQAVELVIPPLLENDFVAVQNLAKNALLISSPAPDIYPIPVSIPCSSASSSSKWVAIADIQVQPGLDFELSIEDEARECFKILLDHLEEHELTYSHISIINLFISSMDLFSPINAVYSTFFGSNPPARACVAVDLVPPSRIKLDCLAYLEQKPEDRYALHVQGLSYWAPANIGPYSQAVMVNEQVFVSGQIGMQPCDLNLPSPQSLSMETALSCQHVSRVLDALRGHSAGTWRGYTQLAVYWLQNHEHLPLVKHACKTTEAAGTPTLYLVVAALPKGALVEKQVLVHTGKILLEDEDGDLETRLFTPVVGEEVIIGSNNSQIHLEYSHCNRSRLSALVCFRGPIQEYMLLALEQRLAELSDEEIGYGRLFYRSAKNLPPIALPPSLKRFPITTIPCRSISSNVGENWDYALCVLTLG